MRTIEIDINGRYQEREFAKTIQIIPENGVADDVAMMHGILPFITACREGDCTNVLISKPRIVEQLELKPESSDKQIAEWLCGITARQNPYPASSEPTVVREPSAVVESTVHVPDPY